MASRRVHFGALSGSDSTGAMEKRPMNEVGKILVVVGLAIAVIGVAFLLVGRTGLPLGRLPGDFSYKGKGFSFYFPLGSSILISVILSLIFYLISLFRR